jgi:hypothetical protein
MKICINFETKEINIKTHSTIGVLATMLAKYFSGSQWEEFEILIGDGTDEDTDISG